MAVSKDTEKGTWTSQIWVEDWQGKKKHKKKRGFASKKEALEWKRNTLLAIDSQEIISRYYTKIADYHHYIQRKKSR